MEPVLIFIYLFRIPDYYRFQNLVRLYLYWENSKSRLGKLYIGVVFGYVDKDQLIAR
jgi:hypothetical protein